MTSIKGRYFRQIMDEHGNTSLYFYYKDRFHLQVFPHIFGALFFVYIVCWFSIIDERPFFARLMDAKI